MSFQKLSSPVDKIQHYYFQNQTFADVFQNVLRNLAICTGKHLCWSFFIEQLFYGTPPAAASVFSFDIHDHADKTKMRKSNYLVTLVSHA